MSSWNDAPIPFGRDGYSDSIVMTTGHTSFWGQTSRQAALYRRVLTVPPVPIQLKTPLLPLRAPSV